MLKVIYASANNLETSFDCSTELDCIKEMLSLMAVDTMIRCTVSGMFVNSRMSVLKRLHRLPSSQDLLRNCKGRHKRESKNAKQMRNTKQNCFDTRLRHPETINSVPLNSVLRIKQTCV